MDGDDDRLAELREIKRRRLHELDKQAARFGESHVPPHIEIERAELRRELEIADVVVDRAPRSAFVEALGGSGRFGLYYAELKRANDGIAMLGERLDAFIETSREWRAVHRLWIVALSILVVGILVALAIVATYVLTVGV